jgi:hypothetical protein
MEVINTMRRILFVSMTIFTAILLALLWAIGLDGNWGQDLLLNLLAECFGIGVTVFVIDQLIKSAEERRWRPARQSVYADLIMVIDDLLAAIFTNVSLELYESNEQIYEVGAVTIHPQLRLLRVERDTLTSSISEMLKVEEILESNWVETGPLISCKNAIDRILGTSAFLLEPDPTRLLLDLKRSLVYFVEVYSVKPSGIRGNELGTFFFSELLAEIIEDAIELGWWLDRQVTKRYTWEERQSLHSKSRR